MNAETDEKKQSIKGISVLNPVDVEKDYLDFTVDYAIKNGYNHFQIIGPIHNPVKGNVDGMITLKKYARFNDGKDLKYVEYCKKTINAAIEKTSAHGIKNYMWHHELELPADFGEVYPEILNESGDIEVTSPAVKDYLENKIIDFYDEYPKMDGLILTLHETRVPLLKLKNQKLGKIERVKYVTEILYKTSEKLGKELIVRPFASLEEDYVLMLKAYEEISTEMPVMDKWTQFDWSLTLPNNAFFKKIKKNPLFVETDIFGEYFGKGRFPLMLKEHIKDKVKYCDGFSPIGYVSRIDRAGCHPFGDVNEVNLVIMNACMNGEDVDAKIKEFFREKYPLAAREVEKIMETTEETLRKTIYLKGYYFSELSRFPSLNHCKNHFYFEMMKENYKIASDEWFIPHAWERGSLESVTKEKDEAVQFATDMLNELNGLKDKIEKNEFNKLFVKFKNLFYCTKVWRTLVDVFFNYANYFDKKDSAYEKKFFASLGELESIKSTATKELGGEFYCMLGDGAGGNGTFSNDLIGTFVKEIKESFAAEKTATESLAAESPYDFIVCGGANEAHELKKEVNFSDTLIMDGKLMRICGNKKGAEWSAVNAHGWFSYLVKVRPNEKNKIVVTTKSLGDSLDFCVDIDGEKSVINKKTDGKITDTVFEYTEAEGKNFVRIRFDRISKNTPAVLSVKTL